VKRFGGDCANGMPRNCFTGTSESGSEVVVPIRAPASIVAVGCEIATDRYREIDRAILRKGIELVCFITIDLLRSAE
jgi:hypothetical protein